MSKITLITPPDIFENENLSILFIGMTSDDQDQASSWLGARQDCPACNFYYYQGELNMPWLFYALARSDYVYLNFAENHAIINLMSSYILSKPKVFFSTQDDNVKDLMSYINNNFVPNVESFLTKVLDEQN
jgi:hypothetical protein